MMIDGTTRLKKRPSTVMQKYKPTQERNTWIDSLTDIARYLQSTFTCQSRNGKCRQIYVQNCRIARHLDRWRKVNQTRIIESNIMTVLQTNFTRIPMLKFTWTSSLRINFTNPNMILDLKFSVWKWLTWLLKM